MEEDERQAAVDAHLAALDAEIERLRRLEAAMDERIDAAEEDRRRIAEATRGVGREPGAPDAG